jgi:hypothetical protein
MTPEAPVLVDDARRGRALGSATIEPPDAVVAGSYGTWRLTYATGPAGLAPGSRVRISTDSDTDCGTPQLHDRAGPDYLTVDAPREAGIAVVVPNNKELTLAVLGRGLLPGERIVVTYGDRSGGGPGMRAQTFAEAKRYFWVAVDAGDGRYVTLPDSPHVTIAGGDAVRLAAVIPSTLVAGEPFRLLVRAEDAWGNPAHGYRGTVTLDVAGVDLGAAAHAFTAEDGGVWWLEGCVAHTTGIVEVTAADERAGLRATSNPARCAERIDGTQPRSAQPLAARMGAVHRYRLYWGDPHGGQIVLAAKIPDFFRYARDVAGIDFAGYQRNDHAHSNADYATQQAAEQAADAPGRFVPLPGFEWSGEPDHGGHHNVYFRRHGQPMRRNSHAALADKGDAGQDLPHVLDLHRHYRGADVAITPHVGGGHADLQYHEPALEPALEITSNHGTFEWFFFDALERRYQLGVVGGSDSHNGRPGAETPGHQERRFAKGGLTGLYAEDVTLESIHQALKARRCYATTGARILIDVGVDGHVMGEAYTTGQPPRIDVSVTGTAGVESVELFRGTRCIHRVAAEPGLAADGIRLLWDGASRQTSYSGVVWDGSLRLEGATIGAVDRLRFDSPRSHVSNETPTSLRWHSVICGYRSGVVLRLDGVDGVDGARRAGGARLHCTVRTALISRAFFGGHGERGDPRMSYAPAEQVAFSVDVEELAVGPRVVEIGSLHRRVTASLAPRRDAPREVRFTYTDHGAAPGVNAYWVRVVQTDQEMAWTSPVFVDHIPAKRDSG